MSKRQGSQRRRRRRDRRSARPSVQDEVIIDTPAEDEQPAHTALLEWARWSRSRPAPLKCASAERRYVAPKGNIYTPQDARPPVDTMMAERVNLAMLRLPAWQRALLVLRYHRNLPEKLSAKILGIVASSYQKFIRDARLMLWSLLHAPDGRSTIRSAVTT